MVLYQLARYSMLSATNVRPHEQLPDADYGDMLIPTDEHCREALSQDEEFVQRIKEYHDSFTS